MQLALLGSGDPDLEHDFVAAAEWHLGDVGCVLAYDEALAHLVQAGCDALLAPVPLRALRVDPALRPALRRHPRGVGGSAALADSVIDANEAALAAGVATGIQFWPATTEALEVGLHRLLALWRDRPAWERVQRNGMAGRRLPGAPPPAATSRCFNPSWQTALDPAGTGRTRLTRYTGCQRGGRRDRRRGACGPDAGRRRDLPVRPRRTTKPPAIRLPARTGPVHHAHISFVPPRHALRPACLRPVGTPATGHRFNPAKTAGRPLGHRDRPPRSTCIPCCSTRDAPRPEDTAALVPKAIVGAPSAHTGYQPPHLRLGPPGHL